MTVTSKTASFLGVLIFLVVVVITIVLTNNNASLSKNENGGNSEALYTDFDGAAVDLETHAGKVRIVNSWASWCPFCVEELPDFARLGEEFGDDVVVIAINRRESREQAAVFLDTIENTDSIEFWFDPDDAFYRSIGGFSMPETLFLNREGNVSFHKRGFMTLEEMREHTRKALNEI